MRLFSLVLILMFSLSLEASQFEKAFVDSPAGCFSAKKYPCSLKATGAYLNFEREAQKYHLADKSALIFWSESQVQLMQGKLWIVDSKELSLKVSPALHLKFSGEFFIEKQPDATMLVRNLNGIVFFESKYVFANEALPVGFQNWFGPMDSSGQISRGVIRPIVLADFLKAWMPISGLPVSIAKKNMLSYRELWKEGVEQSAQLYQQIIERRLASHEEKARKLNARKQALQNEQKLFKKMFREKNGL